MIKINPIIKDFGSFKIDTREITITKGITCVMGEIGSGKSELLKLIAGINLPDNKVSACADDCIYSVEPSCMYGISLQDYVRIYDFSFNDFDSTYFFDKVRQFGIEKSSSIKAMSLGQKSIISSLLSLSTHMSLIIIDEPFNNLDPMNRKNLRDCFIEAVDNGKSIILASNNIEEIERVADSVVLLKNGSILSETKMEIINNLKQWFLSNSNI